MSKDMLVIPQNTGEPEKGGPLYNKIEVAWPFTELGKSLDSKLREKGLSLMLKEFTADSPGGPGLITITRRYVSAYSDNEFFSEDHYDKDILYTKTLNTPEKDKATKGGELISYGDFAAEEITWLDGQFRGYIPTSILIDKLKDSNFGHEEIQIYMPNKTWIECAVLKNKEIRTSLPDQKARDYISSVFGRKLKKENEFSMDIDNVKLIETIDKILDYAPSQKKKINPN